MRRLVVLCSAIVAMDTIFFAALTPLLPHYVDEFGLSKTSAGLLVAMYGVGALIAALPAGLVASRLGPKRAALTGLCVVAAASVGFAVAGTEWQLDLARLFQGAGSVFSWAGALAWLVAEAPRERRGELLGTTMGAAVFGALLGPVVGAVASVAGVRPTFIGVAALSLVLAGFAAARTGVAPELQPLSEVRPAFRDRALLTGIWLIALPALLFGVLIVLVSLQLHGHGWGGVAIGALFLGVTAVEVALNPLLGRLTDRAGPMLPIHGALVGSVGVSLGLAFTSTPAALVVLTVAAGIAFGAFYTPALAIVSGSAERLGVAQGMAFGIMNAGWAVGAVTGPAAGGKLADLAGDSLPYLLLAAICLATLLAVRARRVAPVSVRA